MAKGKFVRVFSFVFLTLAGAALPALAQDALRGKQLYHDVGRLSGAGVSCIDCHGGLPGALHGLGKVADNPAAIEYAIGAVTQMTPLRGRLTDRDMADIAAYAAFPAVPSPDPRIMTAGPAATPYSNDRLEFFAEPEGPPSPPSSIRLTNAGALPLRLASAPVLAGPAAEQFVIAATDCSAGMTLAPQQSCAVDILFRPVGHQGLRAASLGLAHDWIRGGVNIALIGRFVGPDSR